jgi:FKBP-type peptidyl-prolyl cis-trans isomerase 2
MSLRRSRMRAPLLLLLGCTAVQADPAQLADAKQSPAVVIAEGRTVGLEYTLTLDDGTQVQTNVGGQPLSYVAGRNQIIPGLEDALRGHAVQDRVKVRVAPEQAYGLVDPDKVREVPLDKVPADARTVGTLLSAQGFDGPIRVTEVKSDVVVLDFNHPLAGKALNFDVLVLSIN